MNPLQLFGFLRSRDEEKTRQRVPVPTEVRSTDAVFLVLRRMRPPLLWFVGVFVVSVVGLSATPGVDEHGAPTHLTLFESFYVMSYTATTIGFGEIPHPYTTEQRLWITAMIYATVIGWAYAVGTLLTLVQDEGFTTARALQRFGRKVRRIREPFYILAGAGETGATVCRRLDSLGRRSVVIDRTRLRIDLLETSGLSMEVPALVGDVGNPAILGLAGLGHAHCVGVLALTDDDEANLAVVETVALLQPEVPVIARVTNPGVERQMQDFAPAAIINPLDRFGEYLVRSLQKPALYQLVTWLTATGDDPLPPRGRAFTHGTWAVSAEGDFADLVALDLRRAGFDVQMLDPTDRHPDVDGAIGCVLATLKDARNIAMAAYVARNHPDVLVCLRQVTATAKPVVTALGPRMVFVPSDLVARECLARIIAPRTWAFIEEAFGRDDAWADDLVTRLTERVGRRSPTPSVVTLTREHAPAVAAWLARGERLTVADLTRDHEDRDRHIPVFALTLTRDGQSRHLPPEDLPLQVGDELLVVAGRRGRGLLGETLYNDSVLAYVATGVRIPATWIWRAVTRRRLPAAS